MGGKEKTLCREAEGVVELRDTMSAFTSDPIAARESSVLPMDFQENSMRVRGRNPKCTIGFPAKSS